MECKENCYQIKATNSVVFGLSGGKELIGKVCEKLAIDPGNILIKRFADNEIFVKSMVSVRNKNVFLIQSFSNPVNDNVMELLIAVDSLKRASAKSITAIIPYFGYARQDRKASGREPITAKLIADLLTTAGVNRITLIDIHSEQEQGFFNIPVDVMSGSIILIHEFLNKYAFSDFVMVAPDYGSVKRVRSLSQIFEAPIAITDKKRTGHNQCESISLLGNVQGKDCVIVDDIIDTAGTVMEASKLLKQNGAKTVHIIATHGLFNGNAIENIENQLNNGVVDSIWVSNSLIQKESIKKNPKINIVCLAELIANVIHSYAKELSLSHLYDSYMNLSKKHETK